MRLDIDLLQFRIGLFDLERVPLLIELRLHLESGFSGGLFDKLYNYLMADKHPSAPVHVDVGKKPMLDFVPFAGPRREMTYEYYETR